MKGFELKGATDQLILEYKNLCYQFDHKIKSESGIVYGLQITTTTNDKIIPYNKAHKFLVHANSIATKATMKNGILHFKRIKFMQTLCHVEVKTEKCA